MRSVKNKQKPLKQNMKTLCTLDTTDIVLSKDVKQIITKKRLMASIQKPHTNTRSKSITRSHINPSFKSKQKPDKSINDRYNQTIVQTRSINTDTKSKRSHMKSKQRTKTEYEESSPHKITLNNLDIFTTVKNVKFHMDEQYNVDPFCIMSTIKSGKQQTVYRVKMLERSKKSPFYIMKKSSNPKTIEKYEREIAMKETLSDLLKPSERKNFSCIYKVYPRDKYDCMHIVYFLEGQPLSWKKPLSQKLIHNLPKNNLEILKHLVVEISKAIHVLSSHGYYHSELRLKNVLVELKQDSENVKVSKLVKLANLHKCHQITDKKSLQSMSHSIYTPPEILNLIIFEHQSKNFNRLWLEYIYKYEQAWKINVWSLGVLILELLNQEPLHNAFIDLEEIIHFQQQIHVQCKHVLEKIADATLCDLVQKMLSTNPKQRPSPEQIILTLTSFN